MNGKKLHSAEESDSSNCSEFGSVDKEPKPIRTKKKPERFGELGALSLSDGGEKTDSFEEYLCDDSSDDYVAEKDSQKRKIVLTISGTTKKSRVDSKFRQTQISWGESFDAEFDQLNSSLEKQLKIREPIHDHDASNENGSNTKDTETAPIFPEEISTPHNAEMARAASTVSLKSTTSTISPASSTISLSSTPSENRDLLVEILARVRNIEEAMLQNGMLSSGKGPVENAKLADEFQAFLKSNHLPLNNINDLTTFERNLSDENFKKVAVGIN